MNTDWHCRQMCDEGHPQPILTYNNNMGGVDLHDQHRAYYPVGQPFRSGGGMFWFFSLVNAVFFMQSSLVNAVVLCRAALWMLVFHAEQPCECRFCVCRASLWMPGFFSGRAALWMLCFFVQSSLVNVFIIMKKTTQPPPKPKQLQDPLYFRLAVFNGGVGAGTDASKSDRSCCIQPHDASSCAHARPQKELHPVPGKTKGKKACPPFERGPQNNTHRQSNSSNNSQYTAQHLPKVLQFHPRCFMHILWASNKQEQIGEWGDKNRLTHKINLVQTSQTTPAIQQTGLTNFCMKQSGRKKAL